MTGSIVTLDAVIGQVWDTGYNQPNGGAGALLVYSSGLHLMVKPPSATSSCAVAPISNG